jgi:hypothetical protein
MTSTPWHTRGTISCAFPAGSYTHVFLPMPLSGPGEFLEPHEGFRGPEEAPPGGVEALSRQARTPPLGRSNLSSSCSRVIAPPRLPRHCPLCMQNPCETRCMVT